MQESIFEIIYKVIQSKYLVDAVFVGTRLQRADTSTMGAKQTVAKLSLVQFAPFQD